MEEQTSLEAPEDEVILGESTSDDMRRIRVYDQSGDFVIEVPAGSKVTFGYFNPASAGSSNPHQASWEGRGAMTMKTTALRIYEKGERSNQLACFLGVNGFRDLAVKKTKLVQKVIVERRYKDDGDGNEDWSGQSQRELVVKTEDDIPF